MKREIDTRDSVQVVTSNNLLKATGLENITLKAKKLLLLAIAQCRMNDAEFYEYDITAQDFADLMGIEVQHVYQAADSITDELMHGFVRFKAPEKKRFKKFRLFASCEYADGNLHFKLAEEFSPFVLGLKKDFTKIPLVDAVKFPSSYSLDVWRLVSSKIWNKPFADREVAFSVSVEEIRKATGTENKFKQIGQLKTKVWDKALRDILQICLIRITYSNHRTGRTVTSFDCIATSFTYIPGQEPGPAVQRARYFKLRQKKQEGKKLTAAEMDEYQRLLLIYGQTKLPIYDGEVVERGTE